MGKPVTAAAPTDVGNRVALRRPVITFATQCFLTAIGLTAVLALDSWLGAPVYVRFVLIGAAAPLIVALIVNLRPARQPAASAPPPAMPALQGESSRPALPPSELYLAIEHIQSIRVLLQVSASYNQPIPTAVPVNLDLVLKHLRKLTAADAPHRDESPDRTNLVHAGSASDPWI